MNKQRRGDYSGRSETAEPLTKAPDSFKDPNQSGPKYPGIPGGKPATSPSFSTTSHPFKKGGKI